MTEQPVEAVETVETLAQTHPNVIEALTNLSNMSNMQLEIGVSEKGVTVQLPGAPIPWMDNVPVDEALPIIGYAHNFFVLLQHADPQHVMKAISGFLFSVAERHNDS